jgi:hypothetical protein
MSVQSQVSHPPAVLSISSIIERRHGADSALSACNGGSRKVLGAVGPIGCKRPADYAFNIAFAREKVCPLTGELRGTYDYRFCV